MQVLFGVDFEVDEGEIVALLGTNGAGKSTLLRAISGLVQASAGAIVFDGRDMTHAPPNEIAERGVSVVPGGQGVFTQLTVADNLRLAGWGHKRPRRARWPPTPSGCSTCSRSCASGSTSRPATCRAASSRC